MILGIGFILACVDQPQGRLLIARGRQLWDLFTLAVAVVSNITLNSILIPRYGGVGAAWATVFSLIVSVVIHGIGISKNTDPSDHET